MPHSRPTELPEPRSPSDPGAEVVTLELRVNGIVRYKREAVLLEDKNQRPVSRYKTDDGGTFVVADALTLFDVAQRLLDRGRP